MSTPTYIDIEYENVRAREPMMMNNNRLEVVIIELADHCYWPMFSSVLLQREQ